MSETVDTVEVAREHFKQAGVVKEVRDSNVSNSFVVVTNKRGYGFGNIIEDFEWDIEVWETFGEEIDGEFHIAHTIKVID